jgi:ribonuclease HI
MELQAAIEALRALKEPCQVTLYTDSEYLKKGITEWLPNWKQRNWKRKGGALANVDLWRALDEEIGSHEIHWRWVRGHAGNSFNERVDRLARRAIPE